MRRPGSTHFPYQKSDAEKWLFDTEHVSDGWRGRNQKTSGAALARVSWKQSTLRHDHRAFACPDTALRR
jgi:hypothetical protein